MKKSYLLLVMLLVTVLMTGCGSKVKLNCSREQTDSGMKTSSTYKLEFNKSNKLTKAVMDVDVEIVNDEYKSAWDELVGYLDAAANTYSETEGVTVKTSNKNYKWSMTITVDPNVASTDTLKSLFLEQDQLKDDAKEVLELAGYTCK